MAFDITDPSSWDWGALATLGGGALLGSANGAQQAGTTTQTTAPWEPQQPYLLDIFQRAQQQSQLPGVSQDMQNAYAGMQGAINPALTGQAQGVISNTLGMDPSQYFGIGARNPYQGQTTAPVTNPYASQQAAQAGNSLANQQATLATNPYLGMDNPYLKASVDSASQDAMRNLMPAFNQAQHASGSFGNSGVADYFGRAAANTLGNIANNAYMGQFTQNQALAQNLGLANAGAINAQNAQNQSLAQQMSQFNAGAQNSQNQFNANLWNSLGFGNAQLQQGDLTRNANLAQTGLNNDLSQYNTGQSIVNNAAFNAPGFAGSNLANYGTLFNTANLTNSAQWNPLNSYSNLVRGSFGGTSTEPYYTNPLNGALGGAIAGSQVYNNLFGQKG